MVKKKRAKAKGRGQKAKVKRVAKKRARRPAARKAAVKRSKPAKKSPELNLEKVAKVTHYFPHVKAAAALVLKDGIKIGDNLYIKGHTTDFKQAVRSMQVDHVPIEEAKKGQEIGLLVKSRVRIGDSIYRI